MSRTYHVYILASASRVLYVGITNHLARRISQHQQKLVSGFSSRYRVTQLVYFEAFGDIRAAIGREKQIKGWLRAKKIALIETLNPAWKDLSSDLR
jgi:putative endonuclease